MNSRELLKAIGGIDDKFIEEAVQAAPAVKRPLKRTFARAGIAVACLALVLGLGIYTRPFSGGSSKSAPSSNTAYGGPRVTEQNNTKKPTLHLEYEQYDASVHDASVKEDGVSDALSSFHSPGDPDLSIPRVKDAARDLWILTISR